MVLSSWLITSGVQRWYKSFDKGIFILSIYLLIYRDLFTTVCCDRQRESELFLDENPSRSTLPKYYCNNSNILCFVSMIKILLLKLKKKFINPLSLKIYCNNFYLLWLISMLKAQEKIDLFIFESYIFVISLVSIIILFSWSGKL